VVNQMLKPWIAVGMVALAASVGSPGSSAAFAPARRGGEPASIVRQVMQQYVERLYVEPARIDPEAMVDGALRSLEREYPAVLFSRPAGSRGATLSVDGVKRTVEFGDTGSVAGAAAAIESAVTIVGEQAGLPEGGDDPAYAALRGVLGTLDPHSRVFTPRQMQDFQTRTRGTFGGIGIVFTVVPEGILVGEVLPATPAERADLHTGDRITAVDQVAIAGFTSAEIVELVRGEPGSRVVLEVLPASGESPRAVDVVRAVVSGRSVRAEILRDDGLAPVLHLTVERFQSETAAQLAAALDSAPADLAGIVLDLRGNPGGLLDQAVAIANVFLDKGVILETRDRSRPPTVFRASSFGVVRRPLPLVVLISRSSASASEVVAAALRPSRALLVGERSYGKGSVQQSYPLTDGGGLLLTVRHYLTPDKVSIQGRGVEPDLLFEPVVVGERVMLGAPAMHLREDSLMNAFSGDVDAHPPEPLWRVRYLRDSAPLLGPPGAPAPTSTEKGADTALRFGATLVRSAGPEGARRDALLAAANPIVKKFAAEEDARIVEAFAASGIDWASGGTDPVRLLVEPPAPIVLSSGSSATLTVRIANHGKATANRVWAVTDSSNPLLTGLVLAFGAVGPGQTREASVSLPVPAWAWERWDPFTVTLRGGGEGSAAGEARTTGGTRPSLAFAMKLSDNAAGEPSGSGDGILTRGESFQISFRSVAGGGDPDSLDVRLTPEPAGSVHIVRRTGTVGFPPGGALASFDARVPDEPSTEPLRLAVSFSGRTFGKVLDDRLEIPLDVPYSAEAQRRPPVLRATGDLPERTAASRVTLRLTVTDETSVKDVYVLLDGRKIHFTRPVPGENGGTSAMVCSFASALSHSTSTSTR